MQEKIMPKPLVDKDRDLEDISSMYGSMAGTERYHIYEGSHQGWFLYTDGAMRLLSGINESAIMKDIFEGAQKYSRTKDIDRVAWGLYVCCGNATLYAYGYPLPPDYDQDEILGINNYENISLPDGSALLITNINEIDTDTYGYILCLAIED